MKLLVVDDDELLLQSIQLSLKDTHAVIPAKSYEEAARFLETEEFDGAIVDVNLGANAPSGMDLLSLLKNKYPEKPVLMQSGLSDLQTVVQCIRLGADDYIEKPFVKSSLLVKLTKLFSDAQRNRVLKREFVKSRISHEIIGTHPTISSAKAQVENAGKLRILFVGETGVGKTPFAMYSNSIVSSRIGEPRPFEQLNCSSLNPEQFQDALFGHRKGAFTGAISDKKGLVELADKGDLFLDEIGDMPLQAQAQFLTFLDSHEYYRLGDDKKRKVDIRILSATNRDLPAMVRNGTFRKDLYSRISQVVVEIPPLRSRMSDLKELFEFFILKFSGTAKPYDPSVLQILEGYTWEEGNVREFRDAVERLCEMARMSARIESQHLSHTYRPARELKSHGEEDFTLNVNEAFEIGLDECLDGIERDILKECIAREKGGLELLAIRLKTSKATLYRRIKKYGLSPSGYLN